MSVGLAHIVSQVTDKPAVRLAACIGLAVPGRPIQSLVTEDRSAGGVRDRTGPDPCSNATNRITSRVTALPNRLTRCFEAIKCGRELLERRIALIGSLRSPSCERHGGHG
jgi:hypothetical protein